MDYRRAVCGAVLKSIVEKIEKKEKEEVRKVKKQELEEEKQKRLMVAKLHGTLYKHKEALKREILKKRSLMEKNLQQEIQVLTLLDIGLLIRACLHFGGFHFFGWIRCCSLHCPCDVFMCLFHWVSACLWLPMWQPLVLWTYWINDMGRNGTVFKKNIDYLCNPFEFVWLLTCIFFVFTHAAIYFKFCFIFYICI